MGIIIALRRFLRRKVPPLCTNVNSLYGKTVIITGANTGIGKEVSKELAKRKARVILACRDVEKGRKAAREIFEETGTSCDVVVKELDLASFKSIRKFCQNIYDTEPQVNILINNAGVFHPPYSLTEDGYETTFAVNYLGHFLLTNLLLSKLKDSARVIIVASKLYEKAKIDFENLNAEKGYKGFDAYKQSKLANLLFAYELCKKVPRGVTVNSLHPGFVATELPRHKLNNKIKKILYPIFAFLFMRTPVEGAQTVVHLATSSELDSVSGGYFGDCKEEKLQPKALDDKVSAKLWELSLEMCDLN
eukprot:gene3438-1813_t